MAAPRPRFRRRRYSGADTAAPRRLGCLWPMFWVILIVVLLALLFGGYRKGTKVGAPAHRVTGDVSYARAYSVYV